MKKTITQYHYSELSQLYVKLKSRLAKHFKNGSFHQLGKAQQRKLLVRIEKLEAQLSRFGSSLKYAGAALMLGGVLLTSEANAQFATNGVAFQVNTETTGAQMEPSIAMDSDGDFVMAWSSNGQDGSGYGVFAQRYNASGVAQGVEFQVNSYTANGQRNPKVAMDADGDFVVVWESGSSQDGDSYGVYGQRYNATGVALGSEFRVSTFTTSGQRSPSVAMDSDGDFVVVWHSQFQDGSDYGIYGQRFNASGVVQGTEFQVNTYTTDSQRYASIAMDLDGDFVVAWSSYEQDGSSNGIYAQRYNASGVAQGTEFLVNTYTTSSQHKTSVAMDSDGDFVVAWESYGQDGEYYGIFAQRYNILGVAQGVELQVNTYTTNYQNLPSVAMDSNGDFVIAWQSYDQDGDDFGIYGQRFSLSGVALGAEFLINNNYTTGRQRYASVAIDSGGDFVMAWGSKDQDGDSYGVYAQRYTGGFPTGVLNSTFSNDVNLYPSPAKGEVKVNIEGTADVRLLDLAGHEVSSQTISSNIINLSGIKSGIYMVEITQGEQKALKKLVVE